MKPNDSAMKEDDRFLVWRRHPRLCLPYEIDMSPNFEIVKYPFLDFRQYDHDRMIPWKGSGLYSGVEQDPALTFQRSPAPKSAAEQPAGNVLPINLRSD